MVAGILFDGQATLSIYLLYACLLLSFLALAFSISGKITDFLLLTGIFSCGSFLSAPDNFRPAPDHLYEIKGRCQEVLSGNHYILSSHNRSLYLNHYYTDTLYNSGDSLCFYAYIRPLKQLENPGEFSYARYLKQKNTVFQVVPVTDIHRIVFSENIGSYFDRLRKKLLHKTSRLFPDTTSRMLIDALCLGYKHELDKEIQTLFITTGTVHLLAVSGLHTGAIYLLIVILLKTTGFKGKKMELTVLPLLWGYACLTGLSPSVVRAATILTFITIGKLAQRTYTPLNSVAASAFFTLLIRPSLLYSLSFLLSYSAYCGILLLYPFLFHLPGTLPRWLSYPYACICLTISAQLLTLPISAFYFHTVNINSFLANLFAVPLTTFLLYSATICLLLPSAISHILAIIPIFLARLLMRFLAIFAPISLHVSQLYFHPFTLCLLYAGLICLCLYIYTRHASWLWRVLFLCSSLLLWMICLNFWHSCRQEVVVFHIPHYSAVLFNQCGYSSFLKNTSPTAEKTAPYLYLHKLQTLPPHSGLLESGLYSYTNRLYTSHDSLHILDQGFTQAASCQILIVTDNVTPEQVFRAPSGPMPRLLICDGSNAPYTVRKWAEFCRTHQTDFHNTAENGYIRIRLK